MTAVCCQCKHQQSDSQSNTLSKTCTKPYTATALLLFTLLLASCAAQSTNTQSNPKKCPLAPQKDITLEQLLISASPQGCLRELIGADLAACFHRQIWKWDGSKKRECTGLSAYAYAAVTGVGNPQSTACPAPGRSLGFMESFITTTLTAIGQVGTDGENVGKLVDLDAVEDCSSTTGELADQVCQLTLNDTCNLVYRVVNGEPAGGTASTLASQNKSVASRPTVNNSTMTVANSTVPDAAQDKAETTGVTKLWLVLLLVVSFVLAPGYLL